MRLNASTSRLGNSWRRRCGSLNADTSLWSFCGEANGRSGGLSDRTMSGCNKNNGFVEAGRSSAEDLRAAARYMASQPKVDPSIVISAGVSTGGFAQVALAADPPANLKAAISFAGNRGGDGTG